MSRGRVRGEPPRVGQVCAPRPLSYYLVPLSWPTPGFLASHLASLASTSHNSASHTSTSRPTHGPHLIITSSQMQLEMHGQDPVATFRLAEKLVRDPR